MSLPVYVKQDSKYYKFLKNLVDKQDLTSQEKERVEKEIELIRCSNSCKLVYALYLLTQKCKSDKQYYVLRGSGSNTLLFYLLGISNISPYNRIFKQSMPYQVALGTLNDPKRIGDEIQVSPSYKNKLQKYLEECFSKDSDFYKVIDLRNSKFAYNQFKTVLIPKGSDPYKYGDYMEAYGKKGFLSCFRGCNNSTNLNILGLFEMPDANLMYEDIASDQFKERYKKFLKAISSKKKIKDSLFIHKNHYINLEKEKFDIYKDNFIELCLDVCRQINIDKGMKRKLIRCREDIWNVVDKLDLSEDDKYDLYKKAFSGKFFHLEYESIIKSKHKNKYKQITKELYDAKWIFPLTHIVGFVKQDVDSI